MNNIPHLAEDGNAIPTANNDQKTVSDASVPTGNAPISNGEQGKVHSFSRKLAREIFAKKRLKNPKAKHAAHETTVLKYLAHRVRTSKNVIDGKQWFYATVDELLQVFPYLGRTTIYDLSVSLDTMGYLETDNHNRYKYDRTIWFHVPKAVRDVVEEDLIYFDAAVAEDVGVVGAVLQRNFDFHLKELAEKKLPLRVTMSPAVLVEWLPFGESTIKRGLKSLEGKYLRRLSVTDAIYGKPEVSRGPYPNGRGSYPNERGPYPNGMGPHPNNDTSWKAVGSLLEDPSKTKPAACPFEPPAEADETTEEQTPLVYESFCPFTDEQEGEETGHEKNGASGSVFISLLVEASTIQPAMVEGIITLEASTSPEDHVEHPLVAVPSSDNVSGLTGGTQDRWPVVSSLEALHHTNQRAAEMLDASLAGFGNQHKFRQVVGDLALVTMRSLPVELVDELRASSDGDEILIALLPCYHRTLEQAHLDPAAILSRTIYHAALECIVGAFMWPEKHGQSYTHPFPILIGVTYSLHLPLWRRGENERLAAIKEEFAERRGEFAGKDEHKEADASLAPAEKMRVFRNALNSMNKVGWVWFDQTLQTERIWISGLGRERIQKLFELNPDLTPADLLPIMDACMKLYAGQPAPPRRFKRGTNWSARMGHRLHIFASHLKTISREVGVTSPVKVYLNDEQPEDADLALAA